MHTSSTSRVVVDHNLCRHRTDGCRRLVRVACATLALVAALSGGAGIARAASDAQMPPPPTAAERSAAFDQLVTRARREGLVAAIVGLAVPFVPEGELRDKAAIDTQRSAIAEAQRRLEADLGARRLPVKRKFRTVPFLAATLDATMLELLRQSPEIAMVEEDSISRPHLASTSTIVGSDLAHALTFRGSGQAIAILDSGVDNDHPFLSGVTLEACFSTDNGFIGADSLCPDGSETQIGPGAGDNCPSTIDGCDHGTHVAGIAAGRGNRPDDLFADDPDLPSFSGVAPGGLLIAVQIGSRLSGDTCTDAGDTSPCVRFMDSDIVAGLEHVHSLREERDIAAVNMSLGGGQFSTERDCINANNAVLAAVANLRSVRIATVASSGNDGFTNAMSSPACVPNVISVGNTTDADVLNPGSNTASFLDLLAPGTNVSSSVPGQGFGSKTGTSMAAPHVAGAWALLKDALGNPTVGEVLELLTDTGVPISVPGGFTRPRIQVDAALGIEAVVVTAPEASAGMFAGQSRVFALDIRRINYDGPVNLVVESTFGVTATVNPASPTGDGATLTVQTQVADSSLGTKTIRVRPAVDAGVDAFDATVTVNVFPPVGNVTSFSPTSGPAGTSVTINGRNLIGSISVRFNGVQASGVTRVSATQIRALVPSAATTGPLQVTLNGIARNPGTFTVTQAPSITSVSPGSGIAGDPVVIKGFNLGGATAVTFGGNQTSAIFTVESPTRIRATVPAGASNGRVRVVTPQGTALSPSMFTMLSPTAPPSISSFSPTTGDAGTRVTINGSGFVGLIRVDIGDGRVTQLTRVSSLKLEARVPSTATSGRIKVMTPNGTATSASSFTRVLQ